jgi:hypothetical protein
MKMNQHLEEALERVRALPDNCQREVAGVMLAVLDQQNPDLSLSPEQIAGVERDVARDRPYATDREVRTVFARLTK